MSADRKHFYSYFDDKKPIIEGAHVVDRAMAGQLKFNATLLGRFAGDPNIQMENIGNNGIRFSSMRHSGEGKYNYSWSTLDVSHDGLGSKGATPMAVEQGTRRHIFEDVERQFFIGSETYGYSYSMSEEVGNLKQEVGISKVPSGIVSSASVERRVHPKLGDITYGSVILQNSKITELLGFETEDDRPVILRFLANKVVGTTYMKGVLGEAPYDLMADLGLVAKFQDRRDAATLDLATYEYLFHIVLGKILEPNYYELLFSEDKKWITESDVLVGKTMMGSLV